jgi:hypothetical protein
MGLRDRMLSLIDSSASQAKSFVDVINDTFERIDFESSLDFLAEKRDALLERGNSLLKDFGDLLKQVKDSFEDFSVTVPFDEEIGETLEYSVDGDKLTVEVKFEDETSARCNKTVVVIPANCDTSKVGKTINKVTKTAVISIPKKVNEGKEKEEEKAAEAAAPKAPKTPRPKRATPPKPKAVKVGQPRGKGGRFVKAGEN